LKTVSKRQFRKACQNPNRRNERKNEERGPRGNQEREEEEEEENEENEDDDENHRISSNIYYLERERER
jgi:hypothetical protein